MFPNEPLSIGGVLDQGISLYRNSFKRIIGLALLASLPYVIASAMMSYSGEAMKSGAGDDAGSVVSGMLAVFYFLLPLLALGWFFLWGSVGHRLATIGRGEPISTSADVVFGLKVMIPLTLVSILFFIVASIGFVLLLVPGLILVVTLSLFTLVPIMEERSSWSSLWRSHALVWRGNYWRVAAVITVVSLIVFAIGVGISVILGVVAYAQANAAEVSFLYLGIEALANLAVMAITTPLTVAMLLVLYNDLLIRREGGDLDEQFAALEGGVAAS